MYIKLSPSNKNRIKKKKYRRSILREMRSIISINVPLHYIQNYVQNFSMILKEHAKHHQKRPPYIVVELRRSICIKTDVYYVFFHRKYISISSRIYRNQQKTMKYLESIYSHRPNFSVFRLLQNVFTLLFKSPAVVTCTVQEYYKCYQNKKKCKKKYTNLCCFKLLMIEMLYYLVM